jgi:hypothetical protein
LALFCFICPSWLMEPTKHIMNDIHGTLSLVSYIIDSIPSFGTIWEYCTTNVDLNLLFVQIFWRSCRNVDLTLFFGIILGVLCKCRTFFHLGNYKRVFFFPLWKWEWDLQRGGGGGCQGGGGGGIVLFSFFFSFGLSAFP